MSFQKGDLVTIAKVIQKENGSERDKAKEMHIGKTVAVQQAKNSSARFADQAIMLDGINYLFGEEELVRFVPLKNDKPISVGDCVVFRGSVHKIDQIQYSVAGTIVHNVTLATEDEIAAHEKANLEGQLAKLASEMKEATAALDLQWKAHQAAMELVASKVKAYEDLLSKTKAN